MKTWTRGLALGLSACALLTTPAAGATKSYTRVGQLDGSCYKMNEQNMVVGMSGYPTYFGVVYELVGTTVTASSIGSLGYTGTGMASLLDGINSAVPPTVIGVSRNAAGEYHAIALSPQNGIWLLDDSPADGVNDLMIDLGPGRPNAVNDAGDVVGVVAAPIFPQRNAVVWRPDTVNGGYLAPQVLGDGVGIPQALNGRFAVGTGGDLGSGIAVVWDLENPSVPAVVLPPLSGFAQATARAVSDKENDTYEVVGFSGVSPYNDGRACVWTWDGDQTWSVSALPLPRGAKISGAFGLDRTWLPDRIVGVTGKTTNNYGPTLWEGGAIVDLAANTDLGGWQSISEADDVNLSGVILAWGHVSRGVSAYTFLVPNH